MIKDAVVKSVMTVLISVSCAVVLACCQGASQGSNEEKPVFDLLQEAGYQGNEFDWVELLPDEQKAAIDIAYDSSVSAGYQGAKEEWASSNLLAHYDHAGEIVVVLPDGAEFTIAMDGDGGIALGDANEVVASSESGNPSEGEGDNSVATSVDSSSGDVWNVESGSAYSSSSSFSSDGAENEDSVAGGADGTQNDNTDSADTVSGDAGAKAPGPAGSSSDAFGSGGSDAGDAGDGVSPSADSGSSSSGSAGSGSGEVEDGASGSSGSDSEGNGDVTSAPADSGSAESEAGAVDSRDSGAGSSESGDEAATSDEANPKSAFGALLTVDSVNAPPGSTDVAVPVRIEGNPGILGMTVSVSYDASAMTLKSAENGEAFKDVLSLTRSRTYETGCLFTWDGVDLAPADVKNGVILTLYFDVAPDAAPGIYPVAVREADSAFDADLVEVGVSIQDGSVVVG